MPLKNLLIGAVLAIVLILILTTFSYRVYYGIKDKQSQSECVNSILEHSEMVSVTGGTYAPEIKCFTKNETLESQSETEAELALAEHMRLCWEQWQEGNINLFTEHSTYCHPCYILDFKNKKIEINDFENS